MTNLTIAEVRKIVAAHGIEHARFCVDQEATQRGREKCQDLYQLIDLIENEELFGG